PSLRGLDQGESQVAGGIFEPDAHHRDVALGLAGGDARSATDAGIQIDRQSPGMAPVLEARVQAVAFTRLVPWGGRETRVVVDLVDRPDANQIAPFHAEVALRRDQLVSDPRLDDVERPAA